MEWQRTFDNFLWADGSRYFRGLWNTHTHTQMTKAAAVAASRRCGSETRFWVFWDEFYRIWIFPPRDVPKTRVGQDSILAVSPLRKIWWRKRTVSELRKIELMSSWVHGGFLLLAAILKGRRKQEIRISSWSTYSSSDSTIRNTKLRKKL